MNCVLRSCAYAIVGVLISSSAFPAIGKDSINVTENGLKDRFQWNEHGKLSWDDFKGVVNTTHNESAAATCCSIGFKTNAGLPGSKPEIVVYNTFYINKSWVRPDARIQSILDHEQGHFDLCEIYTRKLKSLVSNFDLNTPGTKQELMRVYSLLSQEYETRQQAYEQETIHGTNITEQKRWQDMIANELTEKTIS